jgi:hypothetical protein
MKRYLTILLATSLAALSGQALLAGPVSEETAKGIAGRILSAYNNRKGGTDVKLVWTGEDPGDQPAMYVYTSGSGGFVIISGDDNTVPVLAISENGQFEADDMPEHVRWWMKRMEAQVRATKTPAEGVRKQWAKAAPTRLDVWSVDETQVVDKVGHLTPEWDQGNKDLDLFGENIFNKYCPLDKDNKLSVAGCVPVAVAEVLTTLSGIYPDRMPERPVTKTINYTVYNNNRVANSPYNLGTTDFDWEGLRTLSNPQAIRDAKEAGKTTLLDNLSRLMADCGAIIEAMYSSDGTGAYTDRIPDRFSNNFYMSKCGRVELADRYTSDQWTRLLKTELAKHPVLYSGSTTDGYGHAFVFDGYGRFNGADVFHVNFGWRTLYNGYYHYDFLKTGEDGETGEEEIWERDCDAIFDFFPDKDQVTKQEPYLTLYSSSTTAGISTTSTITPGQQFTLRVGTVIVSGSQNYVNQSGYPWSSNSGNNKVYACLRKKDGTVIQIGSTSVNLYASPTYGQSNSWSGNFSCTVPSDISLALGDCIALYFNCGGSTLDLKPMPFDDDGSVIGEIPIVPVAFIRTNSSYAKDDIFPLKIANYGAKYAGTVWTITYPDGNRVSIPQSYDSFQFTQSGKYKIEAAIKATDNGPVIERVVTIVNVSQ